MEDLSKNFSLRELTNSDTAKKLGLNNMPSSEGIEKLRKLANEVLQPIRDKYGKPIIVTSGYRSPALNKAVGGAKNSQHLVCEAADIKARDGNNKELFKVIRKMILDGEIKVGQLIWEYGTQEQPQWVHVSMPGSKLNQVLYLYSK